MIVPCPKEKGKRCPNRTMCNKATGWCDSDLWKKNDSAIRNRSIRTMKSKRNAKKTIIPYPLSMTRSRPSKVLLTNTRNKSLRSKTRKRFTWRKKKSLHNTLNEISKYSNSLLFPFICFNGIVQQLMLWYIIKTNDISICYDVDVSTLYYHNHKLELVSQKSNYETLLAKVNTCIQQNALFIIDVSIHNYDRFRHSNILIINPYRKEIERFEPDNVLYDILNQMFSSDHIPTIDDKIKEIFKIPDYKYIAPIQECPQGLQFYQKQKDYYSENENTMVHIDYIHKKNKIEKYDTNNYCCAWSYFYCDMRVKFPKLSQRQIHNKCLEYLSEDKNILLEFINGRIHQVLDYFRDTYPDIDIDDVFMCMEKHNQTNKVSDLKKCYTSKDYQDFVRVLDEELRENSTLI